MLRQMQSVAFNVIITTVEDFKSCLMGSNNIPEAGFPSSFFIDPSYANLNYIIHNSRARCVLEEVVNIQMEYIYDIPFAHQYS